MKEIALAINELTTAAKNFRSALEQTRAVLRRAAFEIDQSLDGFTSDDFEKKHSEIIERLKKGN